MDIEADASGNLWITDGYNERIKWFRTWRRQIPTQTNEVQDDPKVEIEVEDDLVESVEGEETGQVAYEHENGLLTAVEGLESATSYDYDEAGRMTRVELGNGTWAEIEYGSTDGRVKKVTVDPAGAPAAKTTSFTYKDQPRSTTVILPDAPVISYEIGEDGSVLKWQNALKPPEFESIAGTLYDIEARETANPIAIGEYNLSIKAYSEEGISSIQVYANGNQLISEKACPQVYEEPVACKKLPDEWVTYTGNHPPGILNLEMVIEDRVGQVASKRFWVNIPYTPPSPPDQPVTPRFADVLEFREEHGLDIDLDPVQDELEINDRVFDTINDWIQGNPVAEASMERWGAPLRTREVAELDYRIAYWSRDAQAIQAWAESHVPNSFAGVYIDERAGGLMRVGFTMSQKESVEDLLNSGVLMAPGRVTGFTIAPQHSLASLEALRDQIASASSSYPPETVNRAGIDMRENIVEVGSSNVAEAQALLNSSFGGQAPISVLNKPLPETRAGRERIHGPMLAGDRWYAKEPSGEEWVCSVAFGAFNRATKPGSGQAVWRMFFLTAAHCAEEVPGSTAYRASVPYAAPAQRQKLGLVTRSGWDSSPSTTDLDIEAVRFQGVSGLEPRQIFPDPGLAPISVTGTGLVEVGTRVCYSGASTDRDFPSGVKCGAVFKLESFPLEDEDEQMHWGYEWCFDRRSIDGDSGGPIWIEGTGTAVGVLSSGNNQETCFSPLQQDPTRPEVPSALSDYRLAPLDGIATR